MWHTSPSSIEQNTLFDLWVDMPCFSFGIDATDYTQLWNDLRQEVSLVAGPKRALPGQGSFGHITGGYDAGAFALQFCIQPLFEVEVYPSPRGEQVITATCTLSCSPRTCTPRSSRRTLSTLRWVRNTRTASCFPEEVARSSIRSRCVVA